MDQHRRRPWRRQAGLCLMVALGALSGAVTGRPDDTSEQRLALDTDRSTIEVLVQATFGSFTGKLPRYDADIRVDRARLAIGRAVVNFAFADLKTGIALRDRHMQEWEDEVRYPNVSFHLDSIESSPDHRSIAHGGLVLHGIEHAVSFPVSLLVAGQVYSIDGEVEIDYRDFGLPQIRRFLILTVAPRLVVRFHLQGRLAGVPATS